MPIIVLALFLDGLQAGISLAFTGIFASLGVIPVIGTGLFPLGIALGFVVSTCLSLTLGVGLGVVMKHADIFYPKYFIPGSIGEIIPGISVIPAWTSIVIASILRKNRDERVAIIEEEELQIPSQEQEVLSAKNMDGIQAPQASREYASNMQRYAA